MKKLILLSLFFALSSGITALTTEELFEGGCQKYLIPHPEFYKKATKPMTFAVTEYNAAAILGFGTALSLTSLLSGVCLWASFTQSTIVSLDDNEQALCKKIGSLGVLATAALLYGLSKYYYKDTLIFSPEGLLIPGFCDLIKWTNLKKAEGKHQQAIISAGKATAIVGVTQFVFTLKSNMEIKWNMLSTNTNMTQDMLAFINHMIDGIKA